MSQYYFAVASLPALKSGDKSPITWERFDDLARTALTSEDLVVYEKALLGNPSDTDNEFLSRWFTWEKEFKKELARLRLARGGFENPTALPETQGVYTFGETVKSLMAKENPLEAEYLLDSLRWSFLDELSFGHYFDLETLLAYSLKLQILVRQENFDKIRGQQNYDRMYTRIVNNLESNRENV